MLQTLIIGLREGLEAALVVTILLGAVTKMGRADVRPRIWLGTGLAVLLALVVGAVLTFGSVELPARVEPTIAGGLAVIAVVFVTWMIFWMVGHSRSLASDLKHEVGRALVVGSGWGVVLVAFLSVAREGIETSLFVWSAVQSTGSDLAAAAGAFIGFGLAIGLAALLARGLVRLDLGRFFTVTGAFLVLVASGVLAYGVGDLQEAGALPASRLAYDVSAVIPPDSWYGSVLAGLVGFNPAANWLQLTVAVLYLAVVGTVFVLVLRRRDLPAVRPAVARPAA